MARFQRKAPAFIDAVLDKEGNAHILSGDIMTGEVISKSALDAEWSPVPLRTER
jgi:hypothetical protein